MTLYGFTDANTSEEPAWFHTEDAAARFAKACGWNESEIETAESEDVAADDIMDTPEAPWFPEL